MLNDIPELSEKAAETIAEGAAIYPEIIPEAVYVLQKIYGIGRKDVASALLDVLDEIEVERKEQIREALILFKETRLDYVDCLLLAGFLPGRNDFVTFDKKLRNKKDSLSKSSR